MDSQNSLQEKYVSAVKMFIKATGIPVIVIDAQGDIVYEEAANNGVCSVCHKLREIYSDTKDCEMSYLYGSYQALRFGGRYIYYCHLGLAHFAVPILQSDSIFLSVIGGPYVMGEIESVMKDEIMSRLDIPDGEDVINDLFSNVRRIEPDRLHAIVEILFMIVNAVSDEEHAKLVESYRAQKLQGDISAYIKNEKEKNDDVAYSIDKENELLDSIAKGDIKTSKRLLNEILGDILFYSGFKLETIKLKVTELIVLLSRASIRGGAETSLILNLTDTNLKEIHKYENIEDLTYWLSKIMNQYSNFVFDYADVKHADVIYKAIDYIKRNYMKKITLEDIAGSIYLSPTYFSKIFKQETSMNFNSYVNKVRIEKSKILLLDDDINIADIAFLVGYDDQSYFTKVFKRSVGVTPTKYKQNRGNIKINTTTK